MADSKTVASNLLLWVQQYLNEPLYNKAVKVTNFTTSWKDGMAFCALVHCAKPKAFDFTALNPTNKKANLDLAFSAAKKHLRVEPLLDSDDLLLMQKPDKRSVMTYTMMLRKGINTSNMMSRRRKKKSKPIVPTKPKLVAYDTRSKTNVVTNSGTATKKPNLVLFDTRTKNINTNNIKNNSSSNNNNNNKNNNNNNNSIASIKKKIASKTRRRSSVGNKTSLGRVTTTKAATVTNVSKSNQNNMKSVIKKPLRPPKPVKQRVVVKNNSNNIKKTTFSCPTKKPSLPSPPHPSNALNATAVVATAATNSKNKNNNDDDANTKNPLTDKQQNKVLKAGWLLKMGKFNKSLKNRYFALHVSSLSWYKQIPILMDKTIRNSLTEEDILLEEKKIQERKDNCQGRIYIVDITALNIVIDKDISIEKQYQLQIVSKKRTLKIYALSPDLLYEWKDELSQCIRSLYKNKKFLSLSKIKNDFIIVDDTEEEGGSSSDNDENGSSTSHTRSSWNKRIKKLGTTGRTSSFKLDDDNDNDDFPNVPAINKHTDELLSLIQIVGFNCDLLSFELTRVGVEEENGILAIINSLTRKLNHACDIHKELLSEAKAHSSYMSSLRERSIEKWKKASTSTGTIIEGYLKKCDFKRKTDVKTWYALRGDVKYQTRWFVLEKSTGKLNYYKEKPEIIRKQRRNSLFRRSSKEIKPKGTLSLKNNVTFVRRSEAPKAPPFSFDLVSPTNIFTLVAGSLEEQIAWCTVMTRELKKLNVS